MIELNIGGKLRLLSFGNAFREALGVLYGTDPLDAVTKLSQSWQQSMVVASIDITYCAMVAECRLKRQIVDFTIEEVGEWMDDLTNEQLQPVWQRFMKSQQDRPIIIIEKKEPAENGEEKEADTEPKKS